MAADFIERWLGIRYGVRAVIDVSFTSPSSSPRIVSGSYDQSLRLWSIDRDDCVAQKERAHDGSINCLTIFRHRLISGGCDGKMKVWGVANDQISDATHTLSHQRGGVFCLQPTERYLFSGGDESGVIYVWDEQFQLRRRVVNVCGGD